jgi:RHS repeat-associated protein
VTDSTGAVATTSSRTVYVTAGAGYPAFYNAGFEMGASSGLSAAGLGSGWVNYSGISYASNGAQGYPGFPAPQGVSVATIMGAGAAMLQDVHFPAGTFKINFKAAQIAGGNISIRVKVNDVVVGTFTPAASYTSYSTSAFTINAVGLKTVRFEGASPGDGNRVALDDLTITAVSPVGGEALVPNELPPVVAVAANLSFVPQSFGTLSGSRTITLTNNGSTVATVAGAQSSTDDYQLVNGCPAQLGVGASCNVTVSFLPTAAGPRVDTVAITGTGGSMIASVPVTGTGSQGLNFKDVPVGSESLSDQDVCETDCGSGDASPGDGYQGGGSSGAASGGAGSGTGVDPTVPVQKVEQIVVRPGPDPDPDPENEDRPVQTVDTVTVTAGRLQPNRPPVDPCEEGGGAGPDTSGGQTALNSHVPPSEMFAGLSSDGRNEESNISVADVPGYLMSSLGADIGANVPLMHSTLVGDPIHAGLGNKAHRQTDYIGDGKYSLWFVRTYNAQAPEVSAYNRQNIGPGWTSRWDKSVNLENGGNSARVTRGTGSSLLFNKIGSSWVGAPGVVEKLTRLADANGNTTGWTLVRNVKSENYNAAGRLTSITLRDGKSYTLAYDGNQRLLNVTEPTGKQLTFEYNAKGRLSKMINPAGAATGTTTYNYDSLNRLSSVTYPDNRTRQYKYDDPTYKFALTSIINEVGETYVKFEYWPDGRAKRSVFAPNATSNPNVGDTNIAFDNTAGASTTTDANGTIITRTFTLVAGRVLPSTIQYSHYSAACPTCTLTETYNYTATGKLSAFTDRNGVSTTYVYGARDLPISVTQAYGTSVARTVTTTWHPTLRQPVTVTEPTRVTNYTYDAAGRTTQVSVTADGQTRTTFKTYNADGLLASVKGPRTDVNDTTTYTYFALNHACIGCRGQVNTVTNPKGHVTTYNNYDAHGKVLSMTNANGTTSTYTYDERGRVLTSTQAGQTTTTSYNMNGQTASVTDPYGAVTTFIYDSAQRLNGKDQSNGEKVRYTLDTSGRTTLTQTFDAANIESSKSSTVYDGLNRATQRIDANGKITNYSYDNNGNVTAVTDPNGLTTSTSYDQLNRPILVTDPLLKTVGTTYTADGKIATVRDPNNNITTYSYSGFGEQTAIVSPDTSTTSSTYNAGGLMVTTTDARGKTRNYSYDVLGRMTQVTYNDATIGTSQTYDVAANGIGQLASVTDPSGSTSFTYDSNRRVASKTSVIGGLSKTVSYARDGVGRLTAITYPSGNIVGMSYAEGRVTNLTLNGGPLISAINYFPMGGAESWLLGANVAGTQAYIRTIDKNSRIAQYSTPTGYRALTFDNASRIATIGNYLGASTTPNATQAFSYDNAGRLSYFTGYTSNGPAQANITQTQLFGYDNNGNRTVSVLQGVTSNYTYQAGNNRLASVTGGIVKNNVYDAAGNLTTDGTNTYSYDARGRMVSAVAGGVTTNYLINYQNLRVKKTNSGETAHFVYDDAGHMLGEYDGSGNVVNEIFWLGDTMVALKGAMPCLAGGGCTETGVAYIWTDHLNTPRELTRVNGSNQHVSLWKWDSLPFGESTTNTNPSGLGVMAFRHRFPGQYRDPETGLHQNWNREYDAVIGRYVTSDPEGLQAGANTFLYSSATPIMNSDPLGLDDSQDAVDVCGNPTKPPKNPKRTQCYKRSQDLFSSCIKSVGRSPLGRAACLTTHTIRIINCNLDNPE